MATSGEENIVDRHTLSFKKKFLSQLLTFLPTEFLLKCPRKIAYFYHDLNGIPLVSFSRISYAEKKKKTTFANRDLKLG